MTIFPFRLPPAWICAVLGAGGVLSLVLFFTIRGWEQREMEKRAADLAHEQVEKLQVSVLRSMEVLHSIASLHAAEGRIGRREFRQFVEQALARQPELQALSWNPVVPSVRRAEFETTAATIGFTNFQFREKDATGHFVRAQTRKEYVPVYFIEPLENNAVALGYDLSSDAKRLRSLEEARDTGKPIATAPIQLAQGPDNQAGFLVLLPIYSGVPSTTLEQRRSRLAGFAVAVFRVSALVGDVFRELATRGIEARLFDESTSGELIYAEAGAAESPMDGMQNVIHLAVAGRQWAMAFKPSPAFIAGESHAQSSLVLAGGLAFTLLITAYLYGGWRRAGEIAAANAALQEEVKVRQKAEAAAAGANQAKSDFLASMSHEIRTPLNAILGYAQLMRRDAHLPPEQHDAVAGISSSGHHLLGLINEILDLSKIEAGRMELNITDFDLTALAEGLTSTFRPLCAQKRIGFRLNIEAPQHSRVRGDEGKLRQVLINLVGNAVKFTNAGEVYLHLKPAPNGRWLFEVMDTGLGIPEEEQSDIFKPFHQGSGTRHQGGTGLGLSIAQRQIELLGGKLELQSERGFGSRFFFQIPLAAPLGRVEEPAVQITRLAPGSRATVLVVDDRRENREVLGGMLKAVGCEVIQAVNSAEAMARVREQKPDLILLDLLLPGVNGTETARWLLADPACAGTKIVMHTASALAQHRDDALAAGCVDFIAKPFRCERLYQCLHDHLGVAFEYATPAREAESLTSLEMSRLVLPEDLCARMMVAAELHSTTALKAGLQELRQLGPGAQQLAEHIRQLMRSYDMDAIMRLLSSVSTDADTPTHHGLSQS